MTLNPIARMASEEDQFAHVVQTCVRLHRDQMPLTPEGLQNELPDLTVRQCRKLLESDRLVAALAARGVTFTPIDALTAQQMHALSIYLDTSVPMTHRERLRNAGVTQAQWDGWQRNPRFASMLIDLTEERLENATPQAHLALIAAVDKGERWAVEMLYEINGRHVKNQTGQDPSILFAAMFQILDEQGVPESTMRQVGERMRQLATPGSAPARVAAVMLSPTSRPAPSAAAIEE